MKVSAVINNGLIWVKGEKENYVLMAFKSNYLRWKEGSTYYMVAFLNVFLVATSLISHN